MSQDHRYIKFIPATENESTLPESQYVQNDTGTQTSKDYEQIVSNYSAPPELIDPPKVSFRAKRTLPSLNFSEEDIFKFCQNGDLKKCIQWIKCGFDVNVRDFYGWTPLMAAACSGHGNLVALLIGAGSDKHMRSKQGHTALELAKRFNQTNVVDILFSDQISYEPENKSTPTEQASSSNHTPPKSFECSLCGPVNGVDILQHQLSIPHQLKSNQLPVESRTLASYNHIDPNYKGYQLLRKEGWSGNTGLGKCEDGRRYPIIPVAKHDRTCIGHPQIESESLEKTPKKLKTIHSKEESLKQMEINFRREFY